MSILNANNTRQTITKRSLQGQQHQLADTFIQLSVLAGQQHPTQTFEPFAKRLQQAGYAAFTSQQTTCLQLKLGKMCKQTCEHCQVDAGPDRREKMSRQTMKQCIDVEKNNPTTILCTYRKMDENGKNKYERGIAILRFRSHGG